MKQRSKFSLAHSTFVLTITGILLFLAGMALLSAAMGAEPLPYVFPPGACGALGDLIATAQAARNQGMDIHDAAKGLLEAEKGCEARHPEDAADACLFPSESAKRWAGAKFMQIWSSPPADSEVAGQEAALECSQQSDRRVM